MSYSLLRLLPELAEYQAEWTAHGARISWLEDQIWLAALVGLLASYAVDPLARRLRGPRLARRLHVGWAAIYDALIGYTVASVDSGVGLALAVLALATHLWFQGAGMAREDARSFRRVGAPVLAAAVLAGWAAGAFASLSSLVLAAVTAFIGGGILLSALREELPAESDSRLGAFLAGALGYSALLLLTYAALLR
ncbi:MAG TPA: hypothetical protein VIL20_04300 [Sandaracinaceae bacterium]